MTAMIKKGAGLQDGRRQTTAKLTLRRLAGTKVSLVSFLQADDFRRTAEQTRTSAMRTAVTEQCHALGKL